MKLNLKKIFVFVLQFMAIPLIAYAAGKASVSSNNQTALAIAGAKSDGTMVPIKVDSDGTVQMRCLP